MKKFIITGIILGGILTVSSCYKNNYDISEATLNSLSTVSFRNDVVPFIIAGGCGCHNNGSTRQVAFSRLDTVFYSTILSRAATLNTMANGGAHPGEGSVFFTPSQAKLVRTWYIQGAKDDYVPPPITGEVTYSANIVPIYKLSCKGSTCHGGVAVTLDYTALKNAQSTLVTMMNSAGKSGHPGGPLSLDATTTATFLTWIGTGFKP